MTFIELSSTEVTPALHSLLAGDMPAGIRAQAVLAGNFPGRVLTDDPINPTWAAAYEEIYGTVYPVGQVTTGLLSELITHLRQENEVLIGLWPDDPLIPVLPADFVYEGWVVDFFDRQGDLEPFCWQAPEGIVIQRRDVEILDRGRAHGKRRSFFWHMEKSPDLGIAIQIRLGDEGEGELISEATAEPILADIMEIGIDTHDAFRGRGFATLACAHVIRACEAMGYATYWNANKSNVPSIKLAQKLGYRQEREYRLWAWAGPETQ